MNLGKGFLFPQENGVTYNADPWIPVTPQKPVMCGSNPSPVGLQGNQARTRNLPELLGNCSKVLPERPVMLRSNLVQSSELQVNQRASSSLGTSLGRQSRFLPEKPVVQSSNSIHAEMQGNHIESRNWQKSLGAFSTFSTEKQITSSDPIATSMQGNQAESTKWQELLGVYSDLLQQTTKSDTFHNLKSTRIFGHGEPNIQGGPVVEANACFNYNLDSYLQNFSKDIPVRNGNPLVELQGIKDAPYPLSADQQPNRSIHPTNKLLITSSYSPVGNNWTDHQSTSTMLVKQNQTLCPKQSISNCSLQQMPGDRFPIPYQPSYNLNSPQRTETLGDSCTINCFQIAPVTPDQGKQLKNHQLSAIDNFSVNGSPSQEKDKQEIISTDRQEGGNHYDQLLQSVIASPSPSNSISLKEKNIFEDRGYEGIDLNKTPQQKPPKRKKHRPKVVVEGKPKRIPKPTPSETNISNETPSGKRKYVRKKGLRDSTSLQDNETNLVEASTVQSASKSCRRVLKFAMEDQMQEQGQDKTSDNQPENQNESLDLQLTSQGAASSMGQCTTSSMGLNRVSTITAAKEEQQKGYRAETQQCGSTCNLIHATNQKSAEKFLPLASIAPPATARDHTLNVIARTINLQNAMPCQTNDQYGYSQVHQQIHGKAMDQMPPQANTAWAKLDRAKQLMLQTRIGSVKGVAVVNEKRGYKRDYCNISDLTRSATVNLMHLQFSGDPKNDGRKLGIGNSETQKKKKFEDKCHEPAASKPSCTATVKHSSGQVKSRGSSGVHLSSSSYTNGRLPYSNPEIQNSSRKQTSGANGIANDKYTDPTAVGNNFQEQKSLSKVKLHRDCMAGQIVQQYTESHSPNLLIGITDRNMLSSPQRVPMTSQASKTRAPDVNKALQRQTVGLESSIIALSEEKVLPKDYKKETGYFPFSRKARESVAGQNEQQKHAVKIDEIICQIKGLQISNSFQVVVREVQTALVPYKGDGIIVPYEGFDPIRRRKPRPKVDLDPETNRLWNLLMGEPGSESTEKIDKDKEKWWEQERKVFRGRVHSFIARMHQVQGDRRFSRWKGSVVDSVIGVFLTQNVSDHLSSSAFMSLAAEFPVPGTCCQSSTSASIEDPEAQIIDPDGTITYHGRILRQSLYKHNSMVSSESSEQISDHLITETGIHLVKENNKATEEDVFSSQNSSESLILQANEDKQSSSDSEVEDQIIMCNTSKSQIPKNILQTERAASLQKQLNPVFTRQNSALNIGSDVCGYPINSSVLHLQGSFAPSSGFWLNTTSENRVPEPYSSGPSVNHSFSLSAVEATKTIGVTHGGRNMERAAGSISSSTTQETGMPGHALTMGQNTYPKHQVKLRPGSHFRSSQQCISNHQEGSSKSFRLESASETEARRPDEADAQRQTGDRHPSSEQFSGTSTKIPNLRKRKIDVKTKSFEWENLRKQVLSKCGKQKRGKDKMDSMNYEALRHADVQKIAETIKERGMNNMLAERIKDFLNRLVRDHGSIDLEWLRDVPSDKAKDYLLSIRGLGLKSVECIRLLTLHHMAFPVDTNVGRIAVRLGWVPLQPLPESLQLHLLELYPVLESIQKYLWPRLCKLDQRTLYELHYQMITFGKVFCTKSKPNCNACPMRTECRHFASAFASARLALPGPAERSIVSSTTPMAANVSPTSILNAKPLPPPETNVVREQQYVSSQWEPIIEEPATPEPSTEVSKSDIEDMLSEDPDEIPTIDLSFEQLKMNVQSIMQERHMEIPEGDLSRALVALNPADASIPAPKLKNVSRLRTEHQVYEIPDSHPLLKGMDRREPDDPSPYLLAIWTPGETANSTQPPESKCSFQGTGTLCNEKTCFSCNSTREANSQTVRGTLLIPCRTAMRGSFPLNGTYFQVNEVFADHESSITPIDVPRDWLWPLARRTVYFGTSVSTIFRGLSQKEIQYCFWTGFVCVRGFDLKTRAPRPLMARLHYPASKKAKRKNEDKQKKG